MVVVVAVLQMEQHSGRYRIAALGVQAQHNLVTDGSLVETAVPLVLMRTQSFGVFPLAAEALVRWEDVLVPDLLELASSPAQHSSDHSWRLGSA